MSVLPDCSTLTGGAPWLVVGAPRWSQACRWRSQSCRQPSQVLLGAPEGHCVGPVHSGIWPPWDSRQTTLRHSQRLPEAPSDIITFCWCDEGSLVAVDLVGRMLWSDGLSQGALRIVQIKHVYSVMLAMVGDGPSRSQFRSEPNHSQISGPCHQFTWTIYSGMFWWTSPTLSELGGLSAGCTAGLSVDSYNALACAVW